MLKFEYIYFLIVLVVLDGTFSALYNQYLTQTELEITYTIIIHD